jgi:membrane protein YdbS with pleckstrin-like domain
MHQPLSTIRQSPFIFAVRVAVAEFIFSIVLIFVAASTIVQVYEQSDAARVLSFPLLLALIITGLQLLIVFVTFIGWYFPVYRLTPTAILLRSGPFTQQHTLIDSTAIAGVEIHTGWLGRRLGYGTLQIADRNNARAVLLKNVHDPQALAETVRAMIQAETTLPALLDSPIATLIAAGEGEFIEFKASMTWDYHRQAVNKELYEPVMKNLVAFMNSKGGMLLIGVNDEGAVVGIQQDLQGLRKPSIDGFENIFNIAFGNMIGMEYRTFITLHFPTIEDTTICAISVRPSTHPAYLRTKGKEEFYLRTGNSSNALSTSSAVQYIRSRFG